MLKQAMQNKEERGSLRFPIWTFSLYFILFAGHSLKTVLNIVEDKPAWDTSITFGIALSFAFLTFSQFQQWTIKVLKKFGEMDQQINQLNTEITELKDKAP